MIFVDALRHLGPDPTAEQVRKYITNLHGWVGANGVFDFGGGDQHGIGENARRYRAVECRPRHVAKREPGREGYLKTMP